MVEPSLHTRRIQLGDPAHASFQRGISQIVDAIRPTLGPLPRVVAIDRPAKGMTPELLDSGAVIARRITEIADRHADPGAMYLRGLLWRIHEEVGDGAATAAVVFDAVYREGRRAIAAGVPAQRLRSHLERGAELIAVELDRQAGPIGDSRVISRLAHSVAHNAGLATLIAEVIDITGAYGQIDVRDAHGGPSRYELVEGAYWETGLLSDTLIDNTSNQRLNLIDALVLLTDLDLTEPAPLVSTLEHVIETGAQGVLLTARSLSPAVIGFLTANSRAVGMPIVAVKLPGLSAADQHATLDDLEIITGARALRAASGDRIERLDPRALGRIRRGWATRKQFGITGGRGDAKRLRKHVDTLISQLKHATAAEDRAAILARLGKFHRGSATLYIGGSTGTEQTLARKTAERAIDVLRRSLSSGAVPGGGASLLSCQPVIERDFDDDCFEARWTKRVLSEALAAPTRAIAKNSGHEPARVIHRLRSDHNLIFDARSGEFENRSSSGIVDPVFVVRESVLRAVRGAALALTIDGIVHTNRSEISVNPE